MEFSEEVIPARPAAVSLPTPSGRQTADGLWLLQLERPALVTPRRQTPALPQKEKIASLLLVWAKDICPAVTQVWNMPKTGYPT